MTSTRELTVRWINTSDLILDARKAGATKLKAWDKVAVLGPVEVLRRSTLGLYCLIRYPGKVILAVYDLVWALRDASTPFTSGPAALKTASKAVTSPWCRHSGRASAGPRQTLPKSATGSWRRLEPKCLLPTPRPTERHRYCAGPSSR